MSVENFLDTNIFIYQLEGNDPRKSEVAQHLIQEGIATGTSCISFQIVQECLNVISRKAQIPLKPDEVRRYLLAVLAPLVRVHSSLQLYQETFEIQARYQLGFYNSLVLSAALEAGCIRLFSEDLQHGQQFRQLTVVNPFQDGSIGGLS